MAYAQQPRYGAPSRPPHQNHQLSYGSSREPYPAKNGYRPRGQAAEFDGSSRGRPSQEYQNSPEPSGATYGYNEGWPDQDHSYDGDNGRHGGRDQNRGGRWPPMQRPQGRPIEAGLRFHNDPRSRGPPPGRGRYRQQDPYNLSNHYREPQRYEEHYQPEGTYHIGSQERENREYEYDELTVETSDHWTPMQHYNRPSHSDDQAYQGAEYNAGYPQQDRGISYDSRASPRTYRNDQPSRRPGAPAPTFDHTQATSTRPPNPQPLKPCKSAKA